MSEDLHDTQIVDAVTITTYVMTKISSCKSYDELYDTLDDIADSLQDKVEHSHNMIGELIKNKDSSKVRADFKDLLLSQYICGLNLGITLCADQMLRIKHDMRI